MRGDFSRLRPPSGRDEAWLQQQGRVWLDSDWNEHELALLELRLAQHADVVGPSGRPVGGRGFRLGPGPRNDLRIGGGPGAAGHLYADGTLCRNPAPTTYLHQPDYPDPPALPLPTLRETAWRPTPELSVGRAGHVAVRLADGRVLVAGGWRAAAPTAAAELYDPLTGRWTSTGGLNVARAWHTAAVLPDGRVLVVGGAGSGGLALASAEIYDPVTAAWSSTGRLAEGRYLHAAAALPDGRVLVVGGIGTVTGSLVSVPATGELATAEVYDTATAAWSSAGRLQAGRAVHTATPVGTGVLVTGGRGGGFPLASTERFDPATATWAVLPDLADGRTGHTATLLDDGRVLVAGGGGGAGVPLASVEVFDPASSSWSSGPELGTARTNHTASALLQGLVLVVGGTDATAPLASAELLDVAAGRWRPVRSLAEPRAAHTATVLTDGGVLATGGTTAVGQPPAAPAPGSATDLPSAERYQPGASVFALAYLETWHRLVTYLQDDVREIALGGPDTTARLRTVSQVKVVPIPVSHRPTGIDCTEAAAYLPRDGSGRLSTLVSPPPAGECDFPDQGVYTGRDNRLYRVEVVDGGEMLGAPPPPDLLLNTDAAAGARTLQLRALSVVQADALERGRWDVVDGSGADARREAVRVLTADPETAVVTLATRLRSAYLVSGAARLVAVSSGVPLAGPASTGQTEVTVDPASVPALASPAAGAGVGRLWFLRSAARFEPVDIRAADEDTGQVTLGDPLRFDYPDGAELVVRARVTWSRSNAAFAVAVTGVVRADPDAAAPTTVLTVDSLGRDAATALRAGDLVELIGDRAELGPGRGLLCRLRTEPDPDLLEVTVDVAHPDLVPDNSAALVADHLVLRRWDGVELVRADPPLDLGDGVRITFSGSDFRSADYWWFTARHTDSSVERLDDAPPEGVVRRRTPLALLRWRGEREFGVVLDSVVDCVPAFDPLTALQAARVAFDDSRCGLGARTVQEAIEALCPPPSPVVPAGGVNWSNDRPLSLRRFNEGLSVTFSEPMSPATLTRETVRVTLDLPVRHGTLPLHQTVVVGGSVQAERQSVRFVPTPPLTAGAVRAWLDEQPPELQARGVRCRLTLTGNAILDARRRRPLDGDAFTVPRLDGYEQFLDLALPSGDQVPGGDFVSWFYLVTEAPAVRVASIDPAPEAVLDEPPAAVTLLFTKDVRVASASPGGSVRVLDGRGEDVLGGVEPFPFASGADLASGITLTPRGRRFPADTALTVQLRGTGDAPLVDADDLPLDGAGTGVPSDFTSTFTVRRPTPGEPGRPPRRPSLPDRLRGWRPFPRRPR